MPDFSSFAAALMEGRTYANQLATGHLAKYGSPASSVSRAQNMRSAVIAQLASGATEFELVPDYTQFGRVCFVYSQSGARYLLKAKNSLHWVLRLPFEDADSFDVSSDIVFLLSFEFAGADLLLEVAPARRIVGIDSQRYHLLGTFESVERFSPDTLGAAEEKFDQNDDGEVPWWEEGFGEDNDESGSEW